MKLTGTRKNTVLLLLAQQGGRHAIPGQGSSGPPPCGGQLSTAVEGSLFIVSSQAQRLRRRSPDHTHLAADIASNGQDFTWG